MRLIDADKLHEIINFTLFKPPFSKKAIHRYIDDTPTVDAVPVIRCRDCKYWRKTKKQCGYTYLLPQFEAGEFCSRAERKEE